MDLRPTWFGAEGQCSFVDHVCLPRLLAEAAHSAGPLMTLGSQLQLIRGNKARDHAPSHAVFSYLLEHPADIGRGKFVKWDMDKVMAGLNGGWRRHEFLAKLEAVSTTPMILISLFALSTGASSSLSSWGQIVSMFFAFFQIPITEGVQILEGVVTFPNQSCC